MNLLKNLKQQLALMKKIDSAEAAKKWTKSEKMRKKLKRLKENLHRWINFHFTIAKTKPESVLGSLNLHGWIIFHFIILDYYC